MILACLNQQWMAYSLVRWTLLFWPTLFISLRCERPLHRQPSTLALCWAVTSTTLTPTITTLHLAHRRKLPVQDQEARVLLVSLMEVAAVQHWRRKVIVPHSWVWQVSKVWLAIMEIVNRRQVRVAHSSLIDSLCARSFGVLIEIDFEYSNNHDGAAARVEHSACGSRRNHCWQQPWTTGTFSTVRG